MPSNKNARWFFYVISLIVHLCVFFLLPFGKKHDSLNTELTSTLKIVLVGRQINPELLEKLKKRQVVNNEFTGDEAISKNNRFYGKKDQTYKVETIPRKVGQFHEGAGTKKEGFIHEKKRKNQLKMSDLLINKPTDIDQFALKKAMNHKTFFMKIPDDEEASNNDYLEDVTVGEATNLNTQEYKFWGFYNRIRLRLEPIWESLLDERIRKYYGLGRKIIIGTQTLTLIKITLDEEGNVFKMRVLHSSGIAEIDDVAIDAITLSGPFGSVPKGMLNEKLTELEWGFVVRP